MIDSRVFTPMNKEQFDFMKQNSVILRKTYKEEDTFIFKRASDAEISDVLYVHSCVEPVKLYLYYIRKKMVDKLTAPYFQQVEALLSALIFFTTETESTDPFTCEGIPNRRR